MLVMNAVVNNQSCKDLRKKSKVFLRNGSYENLKTCRVWTHSYSGWEGYWALNPGSAAGELQSGVKAPFRASVDRLPAGPLSYQREETRPFWAFNRAATVPSVVLCIFTIHRLVGCNGHEVNEQNSKAGCKGWSGLGVFFFIQTIV